MESVSNVKKVSSGQIEFNSLLCTLPASPRFPSTAIRKRPRGRPSGPRGFVFRIPQRGAVGALFTAQTWYDYARGDATQSLVMRRVGGERDAVARISSANGRFALHCAFACVLAAVLRLKGGSL